MKKRIVSIVIILICAILLGTGIVWYMNSLNQVKPRVSNLTISPTRLATESPEKTPAIDIEKILNEVPFREIRTTKQEYEALGWNRYENKEVGFEIYYPGDWRAWESKNGGESGDRPYMVTYFAPKTIFNDFILGLFVYKEPWKERLLTIAERGGLPIEKLRVNNADAMTDGPYSEKDKRAYGNVTFGSDNWAIDFINRSNNPPIYEQMLKSFRWLNEP